MCSASLVCHKVMKAASDEWVLVTGACGALGSAIVQTYAARGQKVLALDIDPAGISAVPVGNRGAAHAVDLTDATALKAVLDMCIPRREAIGLLVNAVGLIWNEPVLALKGARFEVHGGENFMRVVNANLTASFVGATQAAGRMARTGGGVIVNFSSIAAGGNVGQVAYSAAKAGVEGMTRSLALELAPLGITVNAVAPGFIDVPTTRGALSQEQLSSYARRAPVGRLGQVAELISTIDYLAANRFVNGTVLHLDGGLRL